MWTLRRILFYMLIFMTCVSCRNLNDRVEPLLPVRLDLKMAGIRDMADADSLLSDNADAITLWFASMGRSDVTAENIYSYSKSDAISVFSNAIDNASLNMDSIGVVLGQINMNMRKELDGVGIGAIYTIISPYRQWIFTNDSISLIGLNHYLGGDFEGYRMFEDYYRRHKSLEYLPYDVLEARLAALYPYDRSVSSTVLSALIYSGVMTYAKLMLIPDASLAMAMGLDNDEIEWGAKNEAIIWRKMLSENLLFSKSDFDAKRLLEMSSGSPAIAIDAPGAIARYIGYRIVEHYVDEHPDAKLMDLLSSTFYNNPSVLAEARYNPR